MNRNKNNYKSESGNIIKSNVYKSNYITTYDNKKECYCKTYTNSNGNIEKILCEIHENKSLYTISNN